ncbi:hypothetical protein HYT60_01950 [Candidatus Woesebacteria bacterium]|nr:hypothetical protein [Candidatus Woesebacteria bacterium]
MQLFKVFLFYYSLVATTILLLVSFFMLPKPQNLANTVLLAPVVFFLWTHALNPDFFSAPKWSPKLGAIILVFSFLGIFSYFLAIKFVKYLPNASDPILGATLEDIKQALSESNTRDNELRTYLESEISTLRTKIDSLGNKDLNVLGTTPPQNPALPEEATGQITAKDANLTEIAIYETSSQETKVVGSAKYGVVYPFYEKKDGWYKIAEGWVEARWFTEVNP